MAIFAGATIAIAIMGAVLEVGKLVTAAWLHANWKAAPWLMKSYLTVAVLVLMVITSLGIFGFLSKAHLEHTISTGGTNDLQITNLERQIQNEERTISDSTVVIEQLDRTVATTAGETCHRGRGWSTQVHRRDGVWRGECEGLL